MKNIGFIGIGVMGASMVRNLLKQGFSVSVYNRTRAKAEALQKDGAVVCDSIKDCIQNKDAVITMIGYPKDIEEVYFSDHGIIANAPQHAYLIDMTTSSPKLAERIYEEAKAKGLKALDAPVSGGDIGAKTQRSPLWSAVMKMRLTPAKIFLKLWEKISFMKEKPGRDNM